ncbi:MAG: hypothetical protein JRM80_05520 [Nitrososphaerota archaeon]|nr:hypothetical protein [Nitrososphaerota archaeon]
MTDRKGATYLPGKVRLEFGIAGGLVAACVMSVGVMILSGLNLIQFAWFPMFGEIFGAPGFTPDAAMYGLAASLIFGILWGAIFAFAFKSYTVMKGMGIAAIEFFVIVGTLSFVSTSVVGGTLLSLTLFGALPILLGLAVALAIWGAAVGFIGKRYMP